MKHHAGWRNLGSRFANAVADRLLDKPKGLYLSSFRCMSAMVVQAVTRYSGPYPYVDGLIMQVTQRIDSIEVRHLPRLEGRSNYTLTRLVRLWLNLATSFSLAPLRLAIFAGLAIVGAGRDRRRCHHRRGAVRARHTVRLGLHYDGAATGFRRAVDDPGRAGRVCRPHLPLGQRQAAGNRSQPSGAIPPTHGSLHERLLADSDRRHHHQHGAARRC